MQHLRLLRPPAMLVTPVRHGKRIRQAVRLGIKRPSKTNLYNRVSRKRAIVVGEVDVRKGMTFAELAAQMRKPLKEVAEAVKRLDDTAFDLHTPVENVTKLHDLAAVYGFRANFRKAVRPEEEEEEEEDEDEYPRPPADASQTAPRAPVVTIMGHVDHGKTTLLDALRRSRIVEAEFGGITQHLGAFSVRLRSLAGQPRIAFLDTPGHAAFSAMRQRGADATDMVVLVVAADDGVMPQTEESVRFATAARVPIIVAINKMDAPGADEERVRRELMYKAGLLLEEAGGDVQCVPISALKRQNLDALQEAIVAQAELMELRAERSGPAQAVVLEAEMKKGRGKVATCLVQRGQLAVGAHLVAGTAVCRVRAIFNEDGLRVQAAGPSEPVEVMGWQELPETGDVALQVAGESRAARVAEVRRARLMAEKAAEDGMAYAQSLKEYRERYQAWVEQLSESGRNTRFYRYRSAKDKPDRDLEAEEAGLPRLNVIVKADVLGSVEAISDMLAQMQGSRQFQLEVVSEEAGEITDSDLELAELFGAIVFAFNVPVPKKTREAAARKGVEVREFNVIYHLAHNLREEILSILPEVEAEQELGRAHVLKMFQVTKEGTRKKVPVAGCVCDSGILRYDAFFRVERGDDEETALLFDGPCESLYHGPNRIRTVEQKSECGLMIPDVEEIRPGDRILCYERISLPPQLDVDFNFS